MTHLRQHGERLVLLVALSLCLLLLAGGCANAPKVYEPNNKMNPEQVSHDAWDGILAQQFDFRHPPCNFVEIMPRLDEHLKRPKARPSR